MDAAEDRDLVGREMRQRTRTAVRASSASNHSNVFSALRFIRFRDAVGATWELCQRHYFDADLIVKGNRKIWAHGIEPSRVGVDGELR